MQPCPARPPTCLPFLPLSPACYLTADYAGAAPYSEHLLQEIFEELQSSLHSNPHSEAGWGESRSGAADAARLATLQLCNADPELYHCIFTAGATGKLTTRCVVSWVGLAFAAGLTITAVAIPCQQCPLRQL